MVYIYGISISTAATALEFFIGSHAMLLSFVFFFLLREGQNDRMSVGNTEDEALQATSPKIKDGQRVELTKTSKCLINKSCKSFFNPVDTRMISQT